MMVHEIEFQKAQDLHWQRVLPITENVRKRRDKGQPHPVEDFLFTYYPYPFALLEKWHPEFGMSVCFQGETPQHFDAQSYHFETQKKHNDTWCLATQSLANLDSKTIERVRWIRDLLHTIMNRASFFGCFGLHEWAMVYGGQTIRHEALLPLRLPQQAIDDLVNQKRVQCSHYDAFRFFAPDSKKLNRKELTLHSRRENEQAGCIHANMDLYKWAAKLMPWVGTDLLWQTFELAMKLRALDMRASPYDLSTWGYEPITIETAEGCREYERLQRKYASEAEPLRSKIIALCDHLLTQWTDAT
jgi:hypothetical protein